LATDPVCGMSVEEGPGSLRLLRENRTYYFCSSDCLRSFSAPDEARRRIARRLVVAWPLSVAVALLTWGPSFPRASLVAAGLAAVVQVYAGAGFYEGARDAIRQRVGNMDLLIAVGTSAAFLYSVAVLLLPSRFPPGTYFDASALIVTVILTGNYLEQLTRRRAGSALRYLADLLPSTAHVVQGSIDHIARVDTLRPGQLVRVPPGGRFPTDGIVRNGRSAVDESLLTGEARTVLKEPGSRVLAGALNVDGPLVVEVSATGSDTFVAHVGALLEEAELARVPLQQQADRIAAVFVPFVLSLAVVAGVVWFLLAGSDVTVGVLVFVTVAVTACPCAFGLATPAALLVGTGRAAEAGVLFRGGDAIERAARVDTVMLDKTGTLTVGEPQVQAVHAVPPATEAEVLRIAAGLEAGVHHPLARALTAVAAERGVTPLPLEESRLDLGVGVQGRSGGELYAFVRGDASTGAGADASALGSWTASMERSGRSWSVVLREGKAVGAIAFDAAFAAGAMEALAGLRADGIGLAMVTGDREEAAHAVAGPLSITDVHAGVTPEGKVALVRAYHDAGRTVAFVGDGVNDAAALAAADLGIAVGTGSELARETGQVLLVLPDLRGVPNSLRFARRIVRRVRGNLAWAVGYNAVLLPIAAGALVPVLGLGMYRYLPVLGALAMGLSSTTVLLNSLTLRWGVTPRLWVPAPPPAAPTAA